MSSIIVALLASVGIATWLYTKFMRRSGGNTKNSLLVAGLLGLIIFFIVWSVMSMIESALK